MDFNNEFEDDLDTQDDNQEEAGESTTPDAEDELNFVVLSESDYAGLSLSEQRKYRYNLEKHKKDLKRQNAKQRKQAQRDREKATGVPAGTANKLHAEWQKQRQDVQSNPERIAEFLELKERFAEFSVVGDQADHAMARMRDGIHPESLPEDGRFYEIIGQNLLDLVKRYGIKTTLPTVIIPLSVDVKHHTTRNEYLQKLRDDPDSRYQMKFDLEIDHVDYHKFYNYFAVFFDWYLKHRTSTGPDFYDWQDSDDLAKNFQIPERFLTEPFGEGPGRPGGPKTAWGRLFNFQRQLAPTPYRGSTAGEILAHDDRVLKTLKDLGY